MVLVKNSQFLYLFLVKKLGQENIFHDILERKNTFLAQESKKFKGSKNSDFPKGVSPWLWSKIGNFSIFIF